MQFNSSNTMVSTIPHPPLPASPTLSVPEMILPNDEKTPTSSPPKRISSNGWNDTRAMDLHFSIGLPHMAGPLTPTTPIIYGNGTSLSDIGEVTEAESTPRRLPAPAERRALKAIGGPMRSASAGGHSALTKRTKFGGMHDRKISLESNSTIRSAGHVPDDIFANMEDDNNSVDDSVFQGDDEDSVADSSVPDLYTEEVIASETRRLANKVSDSNLGEDSPSAALSRRAEQILMNAKLRLSTMEGNLTRARTTLYVTPSLSMPSIHSSSPLCRSTPSPPNTAQPGTTYINAPTARHRDFHKPYVTGGVQGHSRVYSENMISSVQSQKAPFILRSASAGSGYIGSAGLRRSMSKESLSREDIRNYSRPSSLSIMAKSSTPSKLSPTNGVHLSPLSEDEVLETSGDRDFDSSMDSYLSQSESLTRSASSSSMQMRDLRDQMHDLKGRLSSLRDRAKEDSMKRRSLQSLRTPSPFTAAEQWYTEHNNYHENGLSDDKLVVPWKEDSGPDNANYAVEQDSEYSEDDVAEGHDTKEAFVTEENILGPLEDGSEDLNYDTAAEEPYKGGSENGIDNYDNNELVDHRELNDYESEGDESVYHDTIMPISHEDREDAFDYEHFFLHSAMGTINQQSGLRRGSMDSFSSEGSVETTRGLPVEEAPTAPSKQNTDEKPVIGHHRNYSADSVSTLATFTTANEGRDQDEDGLDQSVQCGSTAPRAHARTPLAIKRSTFGPGDVAAIVQSALPSPIPEERSSLEYDSEEHMIKKHRPSVSSTSSIGTTRSFPLVNKPKSATPDLKQRSSISSFEDTACHEKSPVNMLPREDQILVEQVVASLGRCVLGLQDAGSSNYDGRPWRRRLDAARRVLEGEEGAV